MNLVLHVDNLISFHFITTYLVGGRDEPADEVLPEQELYPSLPVLHHPPGLQPVHHPPHRPGQHQRLPPSQGDPGRQAGQAS